MKKSLGVYIACTRSVGAVHAEWFDKGGVVQDA